MIGNYKVNIHKITIYSKYNRLSLLEILYLYLFYINYLLKKIFFNILFHRKQAFNRKCLILINNRRRWIYNFHK
jgi:hypothetical protein